jgi:hypothetical protein
MAFPSNPTNGQTATRFGRRYQYNSTTGQWRGVQSVASNTIVDLVDSDYIAVRAASVIDLVDSDYIAARVTASGTGVTTYSTLAELPLADNTAGAQAFVAENNRLYIWNGSGWYNIALINTAPSITSGGDATYALNSNGTPTVITLVAADPEGIPITWSYAVTSGTLGSTATISQSDNVFTVTPSTDQNDVGEFSITFTASDGINLATSVSAFTLVFGVADQYYNKNSLLLKTGSTAGLNNHTFVDESTNSHTVTPSGDVYQGSFSPHSPAGWSNYFDGVNDKIIVSGAQTVSGTFTFECWINTTKLNTHIMTKYPGGGSTIDSFGISSSGKLQSAWPSGTTDIVSTTNVCDGQWHHAAFCRDGTTYRLFVDGVLESTVTNSENGAFGTGTPWVIGRHGNAALYWYQGYISDLRLVLGTAVYTSNFTPPTEPLTAIPGTEILTCQGNRFIDNSPNNFSVTPSGTIISAVSPHLPSEKYDPTIHGGSAYFDGTGDILIVPTVASSELNFATGCSIEGWSYITSYSTYGFIFDTWQGTGNFVGWWFVGHTNTGTWRISPGNATAIDTGIPMVLNQWNHWVLTNDGSTSRFFVNGVLLNATSVTPGNINQHFVFSSYGGGNNGQYPIVGYLSGMRFIKGAVNIPVLYQTSSTTTGATIFVPSTEAPTNVSGTSLLLNMNNAGIYDETAKNNIKMVGNVTTSTTQTKYNDTAMYFDGNGDYLFRPGNDIFNFTSSDFTIETWVYLNAMPTADNWPTTWNGHFSVAGTGTPSTSDGCNLVISSNRLLINSSDTAYWSTAHGMTTNRWYHIAVSRSSGTLYFFVDGVAVGTNTLSGNVGTGSGTYIGTETAQGAYFNGYISDLRITRGVARYTTGFTPPTAPLGFDNAE